MASSVGPDQTARMPMLIWDYVDRKRRKGLFSQLAAIYSVSAIINR